jgi:hypothetical protein
LSARDLGDVVVASAAADAPPQASRGVTGAARRVVDDRRGEPPPPVDGDAQRPTTIAREASAGDIRRILRGAALWTTGEELPPA